METTTNPTATTTYVPLNGVPQYDRTHNTATGAELNKATDRYPLGRCALCEAPLGASVTFTDFNDEERVMIGSCCKEMHFRNGGGYYY